MVARRGVRLRLRLAPLDHRLVIRIGTTSNCLGMESAVLRLHFLVGEEPRRVVG